MKTSAFSAGVVANANVLLSAALGKAVLRIYSEYAVPVYVARFNVEEVEEYLPRPSHKYGLPLELLLLQWKLLPLNVRRAESYAEYFEIARQGLAGGIRTMPPCAGPLACPAALVKRRRCRRGLRHDSPAAANPFRFLKYLPLHTRGSHLAELAPAAADLVGPRCSGPRLSYGITADACAKLWRDGAPVVTSTLPGGNLEWPLQLRRLPHRPHCAEAIATPGVLDIWWHLVAVHRLLRGGSKPSKKALQELLASLA